MNNNALTRQRVIEEMTGNWYLRARFMSRRIQQDVDIHPLGTVTLEDEKKALLDVGVALELCDDIAHACDWADPEGEGCTMRYADGWFHCIDRDEDVCLTHSAGHAAECARSFKMGGQNAPQKEYFRFQPDEVEHHVSAGDLFFKGLAVPDVDLEWPHGCDDPTVTLGDCADYFTWIDDFPVFINGHLVPGDRAFGAITFWLPFKRLSETQLLLINGHPDSPESVKRFATCTLTPDDQYENFVCFRVGGHSALHDPPDGVAPAGESHLSDAS